MTTSTQVTMLIILGFVWGGFFLALATAARKESAKEVED
ncbi:MAG TPA: MetS family NSS transporter small subunit [Gemmatimonadetes bacterium]|nr:MetS family NSS transporter small subunit [Gemmatimonadota bacterium]